MYQGVVTSSGDENIQYGVKAVRQLQRVKKAELIAKNPTNRQRHRQAMIFEYFRREVDPIVEGLVTFLLCSKPVDTSGVMMQYLISKRHGSKIGFRLPENTPKATAEHKVYLASYISPIVTRLVSEISKQRPTAVVDFMCEELSKIIEEEKRTESQRPPRSNSPEKKSNNSTNENNSSTRNNNEAKSKEWSSSPILAVSIDKRPSTAEGIVSPRSPVKGTNNQFADEVVPQQNSNPVRPGSAPPGSGPGGVNANQEQKYQEIQITVIGLANAGKTSFINTLQGLSDVKVRPTMGFRPVTMMLGDELKIRFYDIGGGKKIRDIWGQYYHDAHGFIYVVDSASNATELAEAAEVFEKVKTHPYLYSKPGLVLANKQDSEGAVSAEIISNILNIGSNESNIQVQETYCFQSIDDPSDEVFQVADPRIDQALLWLLDSIKSQYATLNDRVKIDTAKKDVEEANKRIQKERSVLRNKIACAFPDQIDKSIPGVDVSTANANDNFGEVDGIKYLAGEIGVEVDALNPIAADVARLVGYQRLALQLIGALNVPISKKKVPMPWTDIRNLIIQLREDLGLKNHTI